MPKKTKSNPFGRPVKFFDGKQYTRVGWSPSRDGIAFHARMAQLSGASVRLVPTPSGIALYTHRPETGPCPGCGTAKEAHVPCVVCFPDMGRAAEQMRAYLATLPDGERQHEENPATAG